MSSPIALLVDSDESLCESLAYLLDEVGYDVHIVQDGREAVDVIQQKNPSVIIMDLLLSGIDGYNLLRFIDDSEHNPSVFIWTHLAHDDDKIFAKSYTIQGYFMKSSTSANLLARKMSKFL